MPSATRTKTRVLALSGSLRRDSYNRGLLRAAEELAPEGVELELYDGWVDAPAFNEDSESSPAPAVIELRARIAAADALLIATPEYNGSIPGALKNAIDWVSRPREAAALAGKPAAVIGASPSPFGAAWAQEHLRRALESAGALVLEREMPIGKVHELFEGGELADVETRDAIAELLEELAEFALAPVVLAS